MILIKSDDKQSIQKISRFLEKKKLEVMVEQDIASTLLAILQKDVRFLLMDCSSNMKQCGIVLKIINLIRPSLGILILSDSEDDDEMRTVSMRRIMGRLMKPVQEDELDLAGKTIQNFLKKHG